MTMPDDEPLPLSRLFSSPLQSVARVTFIFALAVCISPAYPQLRKPFTLNEIVELTKSGVSPNRVARLVEEHGVAFELNDQALQRLKQGGASDAVLAAVKKMSLRFTEERQRWRQQQEEAKQRAEDARRQLQVEMARKEEERRKAEEQERRQAEAEKAKLAEEQRRQEKKRLAEEKRRAEEEAKRVEAERKSQEEIQKARKIEEDKLRADAQRWMLDVMKNGYTSAPTYNDGDFWLFNVSENFSAYDSRALIGLYEVRYSAKRFQVFKEKQLLTAKEGLIGVVLAMVGRGTYQGGQHLKFPLGVGQKWSHAYQTDSRASNAVLSWTSETVVKGVENIATPAGNFWALKIVREASTTRGGKATFTYYYSPQTKCAIRMLSEFSSGSRAVELIKSEFSPP